MSSPHARLIREVPELEHRIDGDQSVDVFGSLARSQIERLSPSSSTKSDDGDVNTGLENRARYLFAASRRQFARRDVSDPDSVDVDAYPIPPVGVLLDDERRPKVLAISLHAVKKTGSRIEEGVRKPIAKVLAAPFFAIARQIGERSNLLGLARLALVLVLKQIKQTHNANYRVTTEK